MAGAANNRTREAPVAEQELQDQSGRILGPRARQTREKLLEATAALLTERSLREVSVMEIARRVGTSPATFYQYFKDVEEAVLSLHGAAVAGLPILLARLDAPFQGPSGLDNARALVTAFLDHWDEHRAVLRIRDLAADEGEQRFLLARGKMLKPILERLAALVEEGRKQGRIPAEMHPMATAAAVLSVLERLPPYVTLLERIDVDRAALVESSARMVHHTLGGTNA